MCVFWRQADDGPEMNHGIFFESFSVIYDVIHFNGRRGLKSRRMYEIKESSFNPLIHNPINLNLISISMQFLPCFYWQISWTVVWAKFWLNNKRIKALAWYYTFSELNALWQRIDIFMRLYIIFVREETKSHDKSFEKFQKCSLNLKAFKLGKHFRN